MVGNKIFQKMIQTLKKERNGCIPWDKPLDDKLTAKWVDYFEMWLKLE